MSLIAVSKADFSGGCSSVGRVPDCDSGCRGFEPHQPPHYSPPGWDQPDETAARCLFGPATGRSFCFCAVRFLAQRPHPILWRSVPCSGHSPDRRHKNGVFCPAQDKPSSCHDPAQVQVCSLVLWIKRLITRLPGRSFLLLSLVQEQPNSMAPIHLFVIRSSHP